MRTSFSQQDREGKRLTGLVTSGCLRCICLDRVWSVLRDSDHLLVLAEISFIVFQLAVGLRLLSYVYVGNPLCGN